MCLLSIYNDDMAKRRDSIKLEDLKINRDEKLVVIQAYKCF